jgi:hypothetical protein
LERIVLIIPHRIVCHDHEMRLATIGSRASSRASLAGKNYLFQNDTSHLTTAKPSVDLVTERRFGRNYPSRAEDFSGNSET